MKKKARKKTTLARTRTHTFNRRAKKAKRGKSIKKEKKNMEGKNRTRKERKVSFFAEFDRHNDRYAGECRGERAEEREREEKGG